MNDIIAQAIALTGFGNDYLRNGDLLIDIDSNDIFKYCNSIDFIDKKKQGLFSKKADIQAADSPTKWFKYLKEQECLKLRMCFKPQRVDDYMHAGFVGGGGVWLIEAIYKNHSDFWNAEWIVTNQNAPDNKVWHVEYKAISKYQSTINRQYDLSQIKEQLQNSLNQITDFAYEEDLESWGKLFENAKRLLNDKEPYKDSYLINIIPKDNYSENALQLLFTAFSAWVFGGMGSWNDSVAKNHQRHEKLSITLYNDIVEAIIGVINSF